MADSIDSQIAVLAKKQRGYVRRKQLPALGLTGDQIDYRIKVGRLIPVYAGVYAVGHVPTLPQDRAYGALLACGPEAVLSHRTAASVWGIFRTWDVPFDVTAATVRQHPGIRTHRAKLTRADIRTEAGLRVTSPARTVLDNAPRLTEKKLRRAVNDLRIKRYLQIEQLAELLDRCPRHPGAARLREFVEKPSGPTRSELEDRFRSFCERFGLPEPQFNVQIAGREVDAYFPSERVIVELDGWEFHSSRESFRSDRDRDADALALDRPTVRITHDRLTEREAQRFHVILERRRRRAA